MAGAGARLAGIIRSYRMGRFEAKDSVPLISPELVAIESAVRPPTTDGLLTMVSKTLGQSFGGIPRVAEDILAGSLRGQPLRWLA